MSTPKRKYSYRTIKLLFGLSGNQCAHPDCDHNIIETATEESEALVVGRISHIYAISSDGPRGKPELTEKELNSLENLILLCPNHHVIIDGQHQTYPADLLTRWKRQHEAKIGRIRRSNVELTEIRHFARQSYPTALVDRKIEEETKVLRQARFLVDFKKSRYSLTLARKLAEGELSAGTDEVRGRSMAWCVRVLAYSDELCKAERYLNLAKTLVTCPEIHIADSLIVSWKGHKIGALAALSRIDSPMSRSAALMVVIHHDGPQGAVDWLNCAGLDASMLDADGKVALLQCLHNVGDISGADKCVDLLTSSDLQASPVLHYMIGMTRLLSTVSDEFRSIVLTQPPILARDFPLADDTAAIECRQIARRHFIESAQVAHRLGCPLAETRAHEYALWIELRDPSLSSRGRKRLESRLHDLKSGLRFVYLGLQFGINLDLEAVDREIERQITLNGKVTIDAGHARLALALAQESPEATAEYIDRFRNELAVHFDEKSIQLNQIEMFLRAGRPDKAAEYLDTLVGQGLSEAEEKQIRTKIAEATSIDPIEARKNLFKESDSTVDLIVLVEELEAKHEWDSLCKYSEILFTRTRSLPNAVRLATALTHAQKHEPLIAFLKLHDSLVDQSPHLKLMLSWSLYCEGAITEARAVLSQVDEDWNCQDYRELTVNLAIALGDWNSISVFVANECAQKDNRKARELIFAAQLALNLNLPSAKELIHAAAHKGNDDPQVLATAYYLATGSGWENDPEVVRWLERAGVLSGEHGPIEKISLKNLVERQPEWARRVSNTRKHLSRGKIPMSLVAQFMNRHLINEILFPALANLSETDPRHRSPIPAYGGERATVQPSADTTVGIDVTTLLTLGFLDILDEALDAFDTIVVPHSTLAWLFHEKGMARFHQPSRIKDAHHIRELLVTQDLVEFMPTVVADSDLCTLVGKDLALFLTDAIHLRGEEASQRIVVRPYPVHRIDSLMEEEVDLSVYANVLSSCRSVVDRLRETGQITAVEEKKARDYLQIHETPWPNQPEIADNAILYLDDVTTAYFLHLGILGKLPGAGYKTIVSTRVVSETNSLISYENVSTEIENVIERIRSAVSSRIMSGKVGVGKRTSAEQTPEPSLLDHLTLDLFSLVSRCDAIVLDDRFFNQHPRIKGESGDAITLSTLDIVDWLASSGSINPEARLEYRTRLRRAGCFFIPVNYNELRTFLHSSAVRGGRLVETAELKAIRENLLQVRMSDFLQLPREERWLGSLLRVFIEVLRDLWRADMDRSIRLVRSNWIIDQIDIRGWAHRFGNDDGDTLVKSGRAKFILMILTPPVEVSQNVKEEYWSWAENRILAPIKEQFPDLYAEIVAWDRRLISAVVEKDQQDSIK